MKHSVNPGLVLNFKPRKNMHYRIKTSIQYAKTACARNVPKSEATDSRHDVTCKTCQRYIEEALKAIAAEDSANKCLRNMMREKGGSRG